MKLSCNGCRILRKGCGEDCAIRPCLEWINTPQAQANATLFLAKFYGRAGLVNLIDSAPQHNGPGKFNIYVYFIFGKIIGDVKSYPAPSETSIITILLFTISSPS